MYKGILILLFFIGTIFMVIELVKISYICPKQSIIYRYIPRSFEEEQNEPVFVTDIFQSMFTDASPWIGNVNDLDTRKRENINKYFISQS